MPGAYLPGEAATLRKDVEKILTPYGFRQRNDNVRHGYAIGTALLSRHRWQEVHGVIEQAAGRLSDPTAQDLLTEVEQRLAWGGLDQQQHILGAGICESLDRQPGVVAAGLAGFAAAAEQLETAISGAPPHSTGALFIGCVFFR